MLYFVLAAVIADECNLLFKGVGIKNPMLPITHGPDSNQVYITAVNFVLRSSYDKKTDRYQTLPQLDDVSAHEALKRIRCVLKAACEKAKVPLSQDCFTFSGGKPEKNRWANFLKKYNIIPQLEERTVAFVEAINVRDAKATDATSEQLRDALARFISCE
ncbi:MAG: hypothetical protein LBH53_03375 [Puniceicoccales bacterium]|jgi:hypothetical protein|nr:hypothetical protein [Puniceicoccales bacterium]